MNPYTVLGVDSNATPEDIKSAYRRLAAKNHPDRGGSTAAFQEIQAAYEILSDPNRRAEYDNPHQHFGGFGDPFAAGNNPFQDIINQFFHQTRQKIYTLTVFVTLEQIYMGSVENVHINVPGEHKLVQLQIPKSIEDGSQVRYEGIMPDGFLHVQFRIHKHPIFTRQGRDLYCTKQVNMFQLIIGTTINVADITGSTVELTIPGMTKPGTKFKIRGKGLDGGDQYVLIDAKLPDKISVDCLEKIKAELAEGAP